jgi:Tfp pilus assembly protein PilX
MIRPTTIRTRRGIAMMLVLISLFTATIITSAYLASRDNSTAIGANISDSASARWAAGSALEVGVAIMETRTDWRTLHTNGKLLDDVVLGAATIDLDLIDFETEQPPTEDTSVLKVTATATVNGVKQSCSALATVKEGMETEIDLDLSEFAVFVGESLEVDDDAIITRWPESPLSKLSQAIALGTQATGAGAIDFKDNAAAIDSTVYHSPDASASLVITGTGPDLGLQEVPETIPFPSVPPVPVAVPAEDAPTNPKFEYTTSGWIMENERHESDVTFKSSVGKAGFKPEVTEYVVEGDLLIEDGTGLVVFSDLIMVVFGDMKLQKDSFIYLQDDSTLTLYIGGSLQTDHAAIGSYRSGATRDVSGYEPYIDPSRVEIYGLGASGKVEIKGTSTVSGSLYFPMYDVLIRENAALYGRVAANTVTLKNDAAIFYDHKLDSGTGYTNLESQIYEANGDMKALVKVLSSLDDATLTALASSLGVEVKNGRELLGAITKANEVVLPGDPTPRPVPVEFEMITLGTDVTTWENTQH